MLGTIKKEAAACREAFAGVGVGAFAWCCHHAMLCEMLIEPAENRIAYILASKDKREQARRLREFRPVKGKLPEVVQKAYADCQKAYADWQKAYAARQKADADCQKAYADCQKADADWQKAYAARQKELEKMHREECPGSTWDGVSIFGKGE